MKTIIAGAAICVATFVLTYFGCVFVTLEPDVAVWTEEGRAFYLALSSALSVIAIGGWWINA